MAHIRRLPATRRLRKELQRLPATERRARDMRPALSWALTGSALIGALCIAIGIARVSGEAMAIVSFGPAFAGLRILLLLTAHA